MTLTLPRTALAILVGTIGLAAAVPATFAQNAPMSPQQGGMMQHPGMQHQGMHHHRPGMHGYGHMQRPGMGQMGMHGRMNMHGGGFVRLACSPRGAEALDIAFVRLSYRVGLTDTQQPLFDDLKSTALDAQKDFADACKAALPARADKPAAPDPLAGYKARIAIETAHLQALNTVEPKLEAFLGSLDDSQKAKLAPQRPQWGGGHGRHQGQNGSMGQQQDPAANQAPAPDATDTTDEMPAPDDAQG